MLHKNHAGRPLERIAKDKIGRGKSLCIRGENSVCGMFGVAAGGIGESKEKRIEFQYRKSISFVKVHLAIYIVIINKTFWKN